jgi:hypothetical protein
MHHTFCVINNDCTHNGHSGTAFLACTKHESNSLSERSLDIPTMTLAHCLQTCNEPLDSQCSTVSFDKQPSWAASYLWSTLAWADHYIQLHKALRTDHTASAAEFMKGCPWATMLHLYPGICPCTSNLECIYVGKDLCLPRGAYQHFAVLWDASAQHRLQIICISHQALT